MNLLHLVAISLFMAVLQWSYLICCRNIYFFCYFRFNSAFPSWLVKTDISPVVFFFLLVFVFVQHIQQWPSSRLRLIGTECEYLIFLILSSGLCNYKLTAGFNDFITKTYICFASVVFCWHCIALAIAKRMLPCRYLILWVCQIMSGKNLKKSWYAFIGS